MAGQCPSSRYAGLVLPLGLIYLILVSLVVLAAIESARLQFRMAGNYQLREQARQQARGIVREIGAAEAYFRENLDPGQVDCAIGSNADNCDFKRLPQPDAAREQAAQVDYRVIRRYPQHAQALPVRERESLASSARRNRFLMYEVQVKFDQTGEGRGAIELVRGVAIRAPQQP